MNSAIAIIISYAINFIIFYFWLKDAERLSIDLSFRTKVLYFLLPPIVLIWYLIVRTGKKKKLSEEHADDVEDHVI